MTSDKETFWNTLSDMTVCMVTTQDDGVLRSRPMAPYVDTKKKTIHFITGSDSAKIFEIAEDQDIALNFANDSKMIYVSVSAKGKVSRDKALIKELWGPYCKVFFGDDPDTADVAVIEARPVQAEIWDNSGSKLAIAAEMTRAFFSDDGPDLGDNTKIDFS
ncbi:MAG: pyridoxamine 5'-phosphate oxidase family protein [Pseudomonadota bacterium]